MCIKKREKYINDPTMFTVTGWIEEGEGKPPFWPTHVM